MAEDPPDPPGIQPNPGFAADSQLSFKRKTNAGNVRKGQGVNRHNSY